MKKIILILTAIAATASISLAQTTYNPTPGVGVGVATVTPTPTATPTQTTSGTIPVWHHYTVNLAQVQALGSGASANLTLDTLPANAVVEGVLIKPSIALTGPSATTGTMTVRTVTGTLHSAYTVIGVTPGATVFTLVNAGTTAANSPVFSSGALSVAIATDTTGGLAAVTAFGADVWVKWSTL